MSKIQQDKYSISIIASGYLVIPYIRCIYVPTYRLYQEEIKITSTTTTITQPI
mgnify:CR=1 FL=1